MIDHLPTAGVESYRDERLYPLPQPGELSSWLGVVEDHYAGTTPEEKATMRMIPEEELILTGTLRFIDHCLPDEPGVRRVKARFSHIVRSRLAGERTLDLLPVAEIDLDDLRQIQRLRALQAIRSFDGSLGTVFGFLSQAIINQTNTETVRALRLGFSLQHSGPQALTPKSQHVRRVIRNVVGSKYELGYSDEIAAWQQHYAYVAKEPIACSEAEEEVDVRHLPYDQRPAEPVVDIEDAETGDWLSLVESRRSDDLERVFDRIKPYIELTDKHKDLLRLRYEEGLTLEEVGCLPDYNCTKQAISQLEKRVLQKIRSAYQQADLYELYR